jgi:opacity protein-like surface antigen
MGNLTPFIAAGLALANLGIAEVCGDEDPGGLYTGGTVGAGLELKLSPKAAVRGEFLYDFYGRKQYEDFSATLQAWTFRAGFVFDLP